MSVHGAVVDFQTVVERYLVFGQSELLTPLFRNKSIPAVRTAIIITTNPQSELAGMDTIAAPSVLAREPTRNFGRGLMY